MWWLILILAVLGIAFIAQLSHLKHKAGIIALIVFLAFMGITFVLVARANSVDLGSSSGFFSGIKLYFSWIGHALGNLKVLTGNAVRMEWFSNSTG